MPSLRRHQMGALHVGKISRPPVRLLLVFGVRILLDLGVHMHKSSWQAKAHACHIEHNRCNPEIWSSASRGSWPDPGLRWS